MSYSIFKLLWPYSLTAFTQQNIHVPLTIEWIIREKICYRKSILILNCILLIMHYDLRIILPFLNFHFRFACNLQTQTHSQLLWSFANYTLNCWTTVESININVKSINKYCIISLFLLRDRSERPYKVSISYNELHNKKHSLFAWASW